MPSHVSGVCNVTFFRVFFVLFKLRTDTLRHTDCDLILKLKIGLFSPVWPKEKRCRQHDIPCKLTLDLCVMQCFLWLRWSCQGCLALRWLYNRMADRSNSLFSLWSQHHFLSRLLLKTEWNSAAHHHDSVSQGERAHDSFLQPRWERGCSHAGS